MSKKKSAREELHMITTSPAKRPYGARVRGHFQTAGSLGRIEEACVLLPSGAFLTISQAQKAPWEGGAKYVMSLEGFPTAASAEQAGLRMVQALLWLSVSLNSPVILEYSTYTPATIFERNVSRGATASGYGEVSYDPVRVCRELRDGFGSLEDPDPRILLSMEIFCAAGLEGSQRARFLGIVSALEPLAKQERHGPEVQTLVDSWLQLLDASSVSEPTRESLANRVRQLGEESVRFSLRRFIAQVLPSEADAWDIVDQAYSIRSSIIHTGRPQDLDIDLNFEAQRVAIILRKIYSKLLGRELWVRAS